MAQLPVLVKPPVIDAEIVGEELPKTKFIHLRYHFEIDPLTGQQVKTKQNKFGICNRGGVTIAYQRSLDGKSLIYAFTLCRLKDNFSRYQGRMIAQCYLTNDEEHYRISTDPIVPNSGYMQGIVERKIRAKVAAKNSDLNLYKVLW